MVYVCNGIYYNCIELCLQIWKDGQTMYFWKDYLINSIYQWYYVFGLFLICDYGHWKAVCQTLSDGARFILFYIYIFSTIFLGLFKKHMYHFYSKKKVIFILKIPILFIKPLYIQWPRFFHSPQSWQVWKCPTISQMEALGFRNLTLMAWFWAVFSHPAATPRSEERGKSGTSFGQNRCHFRSLTISRPLLPDGGGRENTPQRQSSRIYMLHHRPLVVGSGNGRSWWFGAAAVGKQWRRPSPLMVPLGISQLFPPCKKQYVSTRNRTSHFERGSLPGLATCGDAGRRQQTHHRSVSPQITRVNNSHSPSVFQSINDMR